RAFNNDAPRPTDPSKFTLAVTNPNLLVKEQNATDILQVSDADNPAAYNDAAPELHGQENPFGEGRLFYDTRTGYGTPTNSGDRPALNLFHLEGFGMGGDRLLGTVPNPLDPTQRVPVVAPGGITFKDIEDLDVTLGPGANKFTVEASPAGTLTRINTGAGDDLVYVKKISGHTFVNGGAGADVIHVTNDRQRLSDLLGLL